MYKTFNEINVITYWGKMFIMNKRPKLGFLSIN